MWVRVVLLVLGLGLFAFSAVQAWLLYTDIAPYHQMYNQATAAQDEEVGRRMAAALIGLPVGVVVAAGAGLWGRASARPRRWLKGLGWFLLAASLQGCSACARLPYGFGSGYEHASPAQLGHMDLAKWVCIGWFVVAVVVFTCSAKGGAAGVPEGEAGKGLGATG